MSYLRLARPKRTPADPVLPVRTYEAVHTVDRARLARYAAVCGFRPRDELPPTYPHVPAFPLTMRMLADLPFGALGLVHVSNLIVVPAPVLADTRMTLRVGAENLVRTSRGWSFDAVTVASVDDRPVWTERSTYLRRVRAAPGAWMDRSGRPDTQNGPSTRPDEGAPDAEWLVGKDAGRRYARVSGDWNPIHVHKLIARPFGFSTPIAHGMWLLARCVAAAGEPTHGTIQVTFRRPVALPSKVGFHCRDGAFALGRDETTYLTGSISET